MNSKRAIVYLHASKESNFAVADQIGLAENAAMRFRHACSEVKCEGVVNVATGDFSPESFHYNGKVYACQEIIPYEKQKPAFVGTTCETIPVGVVKYRFVVLVPGSANSGAADQWLTDFYDRVKGFSVIELKVTNWEWIFAIYAKEGDRRNVAPFLQACKVLALDVKEL